MLGKNQYGRQKKTEYTTRSQTTVLVRIFFFFVFCDAHFKDCLHYKMVNSQNLLSAAQVKDFFYFVEKLCSVLKMFKFL